MKTLKDQPISILESHVSTSAHFCFSLYIYYYSLEKTNKGPTRSRSGKPVPALARLCLSLYKFVTLWRKLAKELSVQALLLSFALHVYVLLLSGEN